jgi:hypothetical protein
MLDLRRSGNKLPLFARRSSPVKNGFGQTRFFRAVFAWKKHFYALELFAAFTCPLILNAP